MKAIAAGVLAGLRQQAAGEEIRRQVAVLGARLAVKAVYFVHVFGLVVATCEVHARRRGALKRHQRDDALAREAAAVHEVAHKNI